MKTRYLFGIPFVTIFIKNIEVECLIDTGFNGALMLPKENVDTLHLPRAGVAEYMLADGSASSSEVYLSEIRWLNETRKALIVAGESDVALVGMGLLKHAKTTINPSKNTLTIETN